MCRSYSGDPSSPAYACDCVAFEGEERSMKPRTCPHGRTFAELCEPCRILAEEAGQKRWAHLRETP